MNEQIRFEVQHEAPKSRRGWLAVGGREGFIDLCNEDRVKTRVHTVEEARKSIAKLQADLEENWIKPPKYRIVKITVVTTYDVVE